MNISTISIISTIYLVELIKIFNAEENCFFRVEGGRVFGRKSCPKKGVFCHSQVRRILPYLRCNGFADIDRRGPGTCGKMVILYSEEASPPTPDMKWGNSPIDKGEMVIRNFEFLWESPMLCIKRDTFDTVLGNSIDWGALFKG